MGQTNGIERPSKMKLRIQSDMDWFLKRYGPTKKAHWEAVKREAFDRKMELHVIYRRDKLQKRV